MCNPENLAKSLSSNFNERPCLKQINKESDLGSLKAELWPPHIHKHGCISSYKKTTWLSFYSAVSWRELVAI